MSNKARHLLATLLLASACTLVHADEAAPFLDFNVTTPVPATDPTPAWVWLAGKAADTLLPKYDPARLTFFANPTLVVGFSATRRASYIGNELRDDRPQTLLLPFANYTFENGVTLGLQAETTYSAYNNEWDTPINLTLSRRFDFGTQALTVGGGLQQFSSETPRWGLGVMWQLPLAQ